MDKRTGGNPQAEDLFAEELTVRVDKEELDILDTYCNKEGIDRAEGVCAGIRRLAEPLRKKPGPHPENPKECAIQSRMDADSIHELKEIQRILNVSQSEAIRRGIVHLYNNINKE